MIFDVNTDSFMCQMIIKLFVILVFYICGYVYKSLSLKERLWKCPECGSVNERDLNASKNILRRGIYELESKRKTS